MLLIRYEQDLNFFRLIVMHIITNVWINGLKANYLFRFKPNIMSQMCSRSLCECGKNENMLYNKPWAIYKSFLNCQPFWFSKTASSDVFERKGGVLKTSTGSGCWQFFRVERLKAGEETSWVNEARLLIKLTFRLWFQETPRISKGSAPVIAKLGSKKQEIAGCCESLY